ncbi:DNA repair protein RecO [Niabella drilacis]|uniref:DNA repair protein RecO n=1 Tax=Niabella drilacis (strain DSM 25811 / CCM 8410 / CCUG 62505 / LMG 26954 / E90) TaxID=1285928 RepID=A0A1G6QAG5_NIADE|nr:DNA repair protein RecO [Niabella drilacis]SDC88665.1 DNA replication and repair protein RecO [Niabella drilacis]
MADILHKVKGVVLRTSKYGETSVIVTLYTDKLGLQSYLVNGVRSGGKRSGNKAVFFQPAALLDLVVYHNELRTLNRIREFKFSAIYQHLFSDVLKNGVALFMIELLHKTLRQPESNEDLFAFMEDSLLALDEAEVTVTANFPVFFAVHLCSILGFSPGSPSPDLLTSSQLLLDLQSGEFMEKAPAHSYYADREAALLITELLQARLPAELKSMKLSSHKRNIVLDLMEIYYSLHLPEFGKLRTLPVLRAILS